MADKDSQESDLPLLHTPHGKLQVGTVFSTKCKLELCVGYACQIQGRNWRVRTSSKKRVEYVCKFDKECAFFCSANCEGEWKICTLRYYHTCLAPTGEETKKRRRIESTFRPQALAQLKEVKDIVKNDFHIRSDKLSKAIDAKLGKRSAARLRQLLLEEEMLSIDSVQSGKETSTNKGGDIEDQKGGREGREEHDAAFAGMQQLLQIRNQVEQAKDMNLKPGLQESVKSGSAQEGVPTQSPTNKGVVENVSKESEKSNQEGPREAKGDEKEEENGRMNELKRQHTPAEAPSEARNALPEGSIPGGRAGGGKSGHDSEQEGTEGQAKRRKCSICKNIGHNMKTCPRLVSIERMKKGGDFYPFEGTSRGLGSQGRRAIGGGGPLFVSHPQPHSISLPLSTSPPVIPTYLRAQGFPFGNLK